MTAQAEAGNDSACNQETAGVPDLDQVAGNWVDGADLAHLPSLRNQWGQGHVNSDLSSLSWLAAPPYSFGYHTGVLRCPRSASAGSRGVSSVSTPAPP